MVSLASYRLKKTIIEK